MNKIDELQRRAELKEQAAFLLRQDAKRHLTEARLLRLKAEKLLESKR